MSDHDAPPVHAPGHMGSLMSLLFGAGGAAVGNFSSDNPLMAGVGGVAGVALGILIRIGDAVLRNMREDRAWKVRSEKSLRSISAALTRVADHLGTKPPAAIDPDDEGPA